jgi:Sulfotransferase domain
VTLRVVGAGLGRTGTASLKQALELLLAGRCYHMLEVMENPEHDLFWRAAIRGQDVDLDALLEPYVAAVDWPACAFWQELAGANPDAVILLSTRDSASEWWASMERTIAPAVKRRAEADAPELRRHGEVVSELFERRFCRHWDRPANAIAAYERHNAEVRRTADPARLLEWQPRDGWASICGALDLPVPEQPFPHENTSAAFRARLSGR